MPLKKKLQIVAVTCLAWTLCLSSCGGLTIKTWFLDGKERSELLRKKCANSSDPATCEIIEEKSFADSDGYRCYSPDDDKAWRNRLNFCCAGK